MIFYSVFLYSLFLLSYTDFLKMARMWQHIINLVKRLIARFLRIRMTSFSYFEKFEFFWETVSFYAPVYTQKTINASV